jgi:hypothetical protein
MLTTALFISAISAGIAVAGVTESRVTFAKELCSKAMFTRGATADCHSSYANTAYLERVTDLALAINVCRQGTGGAHSRGVDCYKYAADALRIFVPSSCGEGSYPKQFSCLDGVFYNAYSSGQSQPKAANIPPNAKIADQAS